jgi:succinyl-diaminopimelate desuccinylase
MITPTEEKLLSCINRDELIKLTSDLVKIDSVIRPEKSNTEHEVVKFIEDWLKSELSIESLVYEVSPGRENLVATIDSKAEGPCLMLEGHTDVVSEGERQRWRYDPFGGQVAGGRIYGRGSCDMKAGLAVNLITLKALLKSGVRFKGKIRLGFVCDEEGMMTGIKDFINQGWADDVDAALIPEPEENQLCVSMKGAIRAVVRVKGKMAHGCMPLSGINPNTRLSRIILKVEEYEEREKQRCGRDEFLGYPSLTFTVIQSPPEGSPAQLNVMPGEAVAYLDIRTTPAQSHDQLRSDLREIFKNLAAADPDFNAEIDFIEERPVVTIDRDEIIVRTAAASYREITGKDPIYNGVPGATDGTFLRAWKDIPCLVNGPGPRHMPHQSDEYVEVDELYEAARIYAITAFKYLQGEV